MEDYFWIYYALMCLIGLVVVCATVARNRAKNARRVRAWNVTALAAWGFGAALFAVYVADWLFVG